MCFVAGVFGIYRFMCDTQMKIILKNDRNLRAEFLTVYLFIHFDISVSFFFFAVVLIISLYLFISISNAISDKELRISST